MYTLRCFGTMSLENEEGDGLELRSQKHSALLLYLLAHRGRTFPRERLASLFWDTEPRLSRHSLSQALYDIRTTLTGVEFDSSAGRVGAGADRIRYDGEQFEEAVRENELRRAVRIYGGRFAPDVEEVGNADFVRWVESERQRYRRLAETALYRHVRASDDQAEWGEMCVSALQLLEMNPLSEDAHRAFMRGLWLQGDQAAAVRHFEEVESFLRRELAGGISQETLDLVDRIRSSRPTSAPPGRARRSSPEMVGRKEEFETLKRVLEALCEEGRSGLVRIHGEAGVGKTRLLEEFRGLAALDGARVLESRCYAAESDVPYGPVVDGLRELADAAVGGDEAERTYYQLGHLFPEAFGAPDESHEAFAEPDAGRRRLYEEAADLVRRSAEETPTVWLVEDTHWMDASSASLLHYVARRLAGRPFLLVLTARSHEDVSGAPRELLEDDSDSLPEVVDLELERLGREDTARLVASVLGDDPDDETVDRIHDLAGGNPFYALELLRATVPQQAEASRTRKGDAPEGNMTSSLKTLLRRRLRGLSPDGLRIMETVAVAGRHADQHLIRETTEASAEDLVERGKPLYERELLRDTQDGPEFAHDITRDFVYGNMGQLQRSALHLSVGEILASRDDTVDQATLARHFAKGGDRARAYEFALEAAKDAERRHAHEEAIQMAEMAVELAPDQKEKIQSLRVLATAELSSSNHLLARRHLLDLRQLTSDREDHELSPALEIDLARVTIELGRWGEAKEWLREANQRLTAGSRDQLERKLECVHLELKRALLTDQQQLAKSARNTINNIQAEFADGRLSTDAKALIAASLAAYELYRGSSDKAKQALNEVNNLTGVPPSIRMSCMLLKGAAELQETSWDQSRATFRSALHNARQHNDVLGQLNAMNNLMCVNMDTGNLDKALDYYDRLVELGAALPKTLHAHIPYDLNHCETLLLQGRYHRAAKCYRALKQKTERAGGDDSIFTPSISAGLGLALLATGQSSDALREFEARRDKGWGERGGFPSRDTVVWFRGYILWQEDPQQARSFMEEEGHNELVRHRLVAYRILWLTELFSKAFDPTTQLESLEGLYSSKAAERLRCVGNLWFMRFSKRWLDATNAPEV